MRQLAEALGNPQRRLPSVLIAGTNGKGSTAATLASIAQRAGYGTGFYTSPHPCRGISGLKLNKDRLTIAGLGGSIRGMKMWGQGWVGEVILLGIPAFLRL